MLDLIQLWGVGFANNPGMHAAIEVHSQLLSEGFEFPPREIGAFETISQTPKVSVILPSVQDRKTWQSLTPPTP